MPVTAKLSKSFYDALGEDVADQLVDWFNLVDATYRADLRELNEGNFHRFDAKLVQRLAEFESRVTQQVLQVRADLERRISESETRFDAKLTSVRRLPDLRDSSLRYHPARSTRADSWPDTAGDSPRQSSTPGPLESQW